MVTIITVTSSYFVNILKPYKNAIRKSHLYFTVEERESQRWYVTCHARHQQISGRAEFEPSGQCDSKTHTLYYTKLKFPLHKSPLLMLPCEDIF